MQLRTLSAGGKLSTGGDLPVAARAQAQVAAVGGSAVCTLCQCKLHRARRRQAWLLQPQRGGERLPMSLCTLQDDGSLLTRLLSVQAAELQAAGDQAQEEADMAAAVAEERERLPCFTRVKHRLQTSSVHSTAVCAGS